VLTLGDPPGPDVPPKAAVLSRLRAAGLPVPGGLVLAPDELPDPAVRAALTDLLRRSSFTIVRAALATEDSDAAAAAGLGLSIAGCRDLAALDAAAARIADARRDPWLIRYSGGLPRYHLLIQQEIPRRWLAVIAADRTGDCVELHDAATPEALAAGATPSYSGPIALSPFAGQLSRLLEDVRKAMTDATALDLEAVIDPDDRLWLVQARPLTRPLTPGWDDFRAAVTTTDAIPDLPGLWRLDAEHNPAPLSPAHAGVIAWLTGRGADLRVLAGWLYEPVSSNTSSPAPAPQQARAPRRAHDDITARLPDTDLASLLDRALAHLSDTLAVYATIRTRLPPELPADLSDPLSLRERTRYLDVLPLAWDIASPTLADMLSEPGPIEHVPNTTPTDPAAVAVLVRELDDHLFALGLAPLRRVYLAAGERLGLAGDIFLLTPPELHAALAGGDLPDLRARRRLHALHASLRPPLALYDGRPVPLPPRGRLRGLPSGPSCRGRIAHRRDLADLLARPPVPGDIIVMPALTAQAAVALRHLGVRAVCCEHGGALSHAALMVRELGLSALVGCRGCLDLPDGAEAELDTRLGRLRLLI
jgi:phosphohistidine swiveling domain-containing protein